MPLIDRLKNALERVEHEGETALAMADADVMAFVDRLKKHTTQYPEPVFAVLRRVKPVLVAKGFALVTRFEDVQEVLSRDDVFQVTYGQKMRVITGGSDFFLGMRNSPEYERDVAHMRSVMRRSDVTEKIVPFVAAAAEEIVQASGGSVNVATELGAMVPARWVASYFGCTPFSNAELAQWGSAIFRYLFTDLTNDPAVGDAARDAAAKARAWLDDSIAKRKANPTEGDDVLSRCLKLQAAGLPGMDDLGIRNNLIGLLTGAIPTTAKCCAQALDELLKRPEELAKAQAAARAGDDALLAQYVFEALRFNPNNPGLFRIAAEDYTVAKGKVHATVIPKGTSVFAATQSGMFDECVVEASHEFRIGRPDYIYMHWGYGLHACFGQYVNAVQIPGILKPLLKRQGLRRADGADGQLQYEGPYPSKLVVQYEK
ncbi:MAG: cytochrome P450 [Terriglobia bacterium]